MRLAFYAPLKAPDHPVPSGDRTMARALIAALGHGGHEVDIASGLRLYEGTGDAGRQSVLMAKAEQEIARLRTSPDAASWQAWITYHNYYKAPDLIGPVVADALGIPYLQIESSRARKRLDGPWAQFAAAAEAASDAAHTILYVTQHDAQTLRRDAPQGQRLRHLPPFLAHADLPPASDLTGSMISVGMMRSGDKLASYTLIAQTLTALPDGLDWRLIIAGDGEARADIATLMAPFGNRVQMPGTLDADALGAQLRTASLLLWPGVNEAFGLAYLEAQAAGVPVVAQDRTGVREVVNGHLSDVDAGPAAMADHITALLTDDQRRAQAGSAARKMIQAHHLLSPAANTLTAVLDEVAQ
ncbi:glycosyltransferase family 4 protein [uncultured Tateyamaria sp.]|uniref:glycosyltransferase family 4 protein n=1 Tax=uncultured Tateyamaria sp. TaxID=455651 RepID=UPI002604445F|nr:glycosyltransferase family 4 protein [uncultured Tateyamaria sp.]